MSNIWNTLSSINVNKHTEKIGELTYLSWAWAWGTLMDHFPTARYQFTDFRDTSGNITDILTYPDATCSVECTLTIGDISRTMWLPVMDYKHKAIPNPSSRQISDNKMRCLTKCIGMFGLGHYIYAGHDLPPNTHGKPLHPPQAIPVKTHTNGIAKENESQTTTQNGLLGDQTESGDFEYSNFKDSKVLVGYGRQNGDTYFECFNDEYIKIAKQVDFWDMRANNEAQTQHLQILKAYLKYVSSVDSKQPIGQTK